MASIRPLAVGRMDVETHDLEDEIEDVLEIQLCVADNFVVGIGKECT